MCEMDRLYKLFMTPVLAAVIILAGCGKQEGRVQAPPAVSQNSREEAASIQVPEIEEVQSESAVGALVPLQSHDGISWGGFGSQGFYYVDGAVRSDGSCNLMYADYPSKQIIYLCAQANCTHDNEGCTSYLMPTPGGIVAEVVGEQLLLFYQNSPFADSENGTPPYIESMYLNAGNKKNILEFDANQKLEKPMLSDGRRVYLRITTQVSAEEQRAELTALDPKTGQCEILREMDAERNERIWGTDGENVILYRYTEPLNHSDGTLQLVLWNPLTKEEAVLYTWEQGDDYPMLDRGGLAYRGEDNKFHLVDLSTKAETIMTQYDCPPVESNTNVSMLCVDSTHLLIRESTIQQGKNIASYYVLGVDGSIQDWDLLYSVDGDQEPYIPITTLNETKYLVYTGDAMEEESAVQTDGVTTVMQVPRKLYAIMGQEDYWNGQAVVEPLELAKAS